MEETGVPGGNHRLRQVTDETFHTYGLCPVRGLNLGRSGVKQSELRRDESGALAHRATAVPRKFEGNLAEASAEGPSRSCGGGSGGGGGGGGSPRNLIF